MDDDDPAISFAEPPAGGYQVTEGGQLDIPVTIVRPRGVITAVAVSCTAGTATLTLTHSDYTCATNSVVIPANAASVNYQITAPDDTTIESDETFTVTLDFVASGTRLVDPSTVTVTIVDNDTPEPCDDCIVSISGGSGVTEGTAATFTVTANPAPSASIVSLLNRWV